MTSRHLQRLAAPLNNAMRRKSTRGEREREQCWNPVAFLKPLTHTTASWEPLCQTVESFDGNCQSIYWQDPTRSCQQFISSYYLHANGFHFTQVATPQDTCCIEMRKLRISTICQGNSGIRLEIQMQMQSSASRDFASWQNIASAPLEKSNLQKSFF